LDGGLTTPQRYRGGEKLIAHRTCLRSTECFDWLDGVASVNRENALCLAAKSYLASKSHDGLVDRHAVFSKSASAFAST
jgi:hypothetical protein